MSCRFARVTIGWLCMIAVGCSAPSAGDGGGDIAVIDGEPSDAGDSQPDNFDDAAGDGGADATDDAALDAIDSTVPDVLPGDAMPTDTMPTDAPSADAPSPCRGCSSYAMPSVLGTVAVAAINEASGIAESRVRDGVFYVHNDSGDTARFFALDARGVLLGEYRLAGATAIDWEDVGIGPCPMGSCVYLGDIGDNATARTQCAIYRVREPAPTSAIGMPMAIAFERFPYVYPDGPHNAESLLVDQVDGDVYIVTKVASGRSTVYRYPAPLRAGTVVTLTRVTSIDAPAGGGTLFTGGSVHPCNDRVLLRVYDRAYEYRRPAGMPFESVFSAMPTRVPAAPEIQGEAIAYRRDGRGYVTVSEGASPAFNSVLCAP